MDVAPNIARIAALLSDHARTRIVWLLIDGTSRPAGELAFAAGVSAQSASAHLGKLVDGGLLLSEQVGRHRYYRLANADVARAIEALASCSVATAVRTPPMAALARAMPEEFMHARTCYDHLAGKLAVCILAALVDHGWLIRKRDDYLVTELGKRELASLGIDVEAAQAQRRIFARSCVDLTERKSHLGGALGAALLAAFVDKGWILRNPRSRTVNITPKGRSAFGKLCKFQQP
jgi:DNA-binding transcriptional ArsR family regulator